MYKGIAPQRVTPVADHLCPFFSEPYSTIFSLAPMFSGRPPNTPFSGTFPAVNAPRNTSPLPLGSSY